MNWKSILLWVAIAALVAFFLKHSLVLAIGVLVGIAADRLVLLTSTKLDDTALAWVKAKIAGLGK